MTSTFPNDPTSLLPDNDAMAALGDKLKSLEVATTAHRFASNQHFCVRLDGVAFHTITKGFQKPFDERFLDAMMFTARDMLEKYNSATLAYVESDEITLLFPAVTGEEVNTLLGETESRPTKKPKIDPGHLYDGRLFKILSTTAGYASARFNYHLNQIVTRAQENTDEEDKLHPPLSGDKLRHALSHTSVFDSRAFHVPDLHTLTDCVYWRSAHDCVRNSINGLAQVTFDKKSLHRISLRNVLKKLADEKGIDIFERLPARALFGSFVKKEQFVLPPERCVNPKTGLPAKEPSIRTRMKCAAVNWGDWTPEERAKFAVAKFWPSAGVRGEHEIRMNKKWSSYLL